MGSSRPQASVKGDAAPESRLSHEAVTESAAAAAMTASVKRTLGFVTTPLFLVAFGLLLVVFDPIQRIALLFGRRPQEIAVGLLQSCLKEALRLAGTRFTLERDPGFRARTAYLMVANHQSMLDIPILASFVFSNFPKYVAKRELARFIPSISFNLRHGGNALIDRKRRDQAVPAIEELGRNAQARGVSVVIYPEGTRARGGEMGPFKPSGTLALLAAAPALPVVPVTIDGSWELLRYHMRPVPFGTRVRVRVGAPLPRRDGEDREALLAQVEQDIRGTLARWRGVPAGAGPTRTA
jgi:1-acyl-sn-glycerol-3-phosphate acyltransferase